MNRERDKRNEERFLEKMIKSRAPKRLWDDCLDESYIRSNTVHGIDKLDGEVPKTIMS